MVTNAAPGSTRSNVRRVAAIAVLALGAALGLMLHRPSTAGAYEVWQNDNFSGAALMPGNANSLHEFTGAATRESGEPVSTGNHTVWFKWTPTYTGAAHLNFRGSQCYFNNGTTSLTSAMHIFTGTKLSNLVLVSSTGNFNSTSGTTYFVAVDSSCPNNGSPHLL